jgi:hypothetical protein
MKKLIAWLKKNGYEITGEYSNAMTFKKISTKQEYSLQCHNDYELYRGNKYNIDSELIGNATKQQQIIDMLSWEA